MAFVQFTIFENKENATEPPELLRELVPIVEVLVYHIPKALQDISEALDPTTTVGLDECNKYARLFFVKNGTLHYILNRMERVYKEIEDKILAVVY